jgi:hypothetical protein
VDYLIPAGYLSPQQGKEQLLLALWPDASWKREAPADVAAAVRHLGYVEGKILLPAPLTSALTAWVRPDGALAKVDAMRWRDRTAILWVQGGELHLDRGPTLHRFFFQETQFASLLAAVVHAWQSGGTRSETEARAPTAEGDEAALRTGMAGRPTKGRDIILAEFARRAAAGGMLPTLKAEATALRTWFRETHPNADQPGQGATENTLRRRYNKLKAEHAATK